MLKEVCMKKNRVFWGKSKNSKEKCFCVIRFILSLCNLVVSFSILGVLLHMVFGRKKKRKTEDISHLVMEKKKNQSKREIGFVFNNPELDKNE